MALTLTEAQAKLAAAEAEYADTARAIDDGTWTRRGWRKSPELVLNSVHRRVAYWQRQVRLLRRRTAHETEWFAA